MNSFAGIQRFTGKTALVTGAASGIGRATALRLAAEGAQVWCADIARPGLQAVVEEITRGGGEAQAFIGDLSQETIAAQCVDQCVAAYGKLDALCNIAAVFQAANTHEMSLADWNRLISINLTAVFLLCRDSIPQLLKTGGNIVNTSSSAGLASVAYAAAYSASKGALLSFSRSLAVEYGRRGLRVNCVCPAGINSGITDNIQFPPGHDPSLLARQLPLNGMVEPALVAGAIAMLASADGAHINGAELKVDGGALA